MVAVGIILVFVTFVSGPRGTEVSITAIINLARQDQIQEILVEGDLLTVQTWDNPPQVFTSRKEADTSIVQLLQDAGVQTGEGGVEVKVKGTSGLSNIFGILINFLPLIFFGAILLFMMRQAQGSNNQTMSFGRSRARMFVGNRPSVTFSDVAGVEEAKQEFQEVVEFLRYPERFVALGARIPHGVLVVGPPGTGKTLLAKAVAGEAGVPFFSISGSEFVEMFVGVGAARVRDLFDQAKRNAPCIIFVDEIDAVGRHRGAGLGGGHDEREQTLNQILVEIDGFDSSTNVIVMAATNRPDILDPALLRPGRFDRRVVLDLPDIAGRQAILAVHSKGKPLDDDVHLEVVGKETPGFSGADLANLVNEAAILAARQHQSTITLKEFGEAIDRVTMGPERRSRIISHQEKEITAYHEAGHALAGYLLPHADPVMKVSIVARGMAGGYTRSIPAEDRHMMTKAQFKDMMAMALAGRISEEMIFHETTTGASNDLETATHMARKMVTRYGMSEKLGTRTFGQRDEMVFLGRQISEQRDYSDHVAELIDQEVHELIQAAHQTATDLLEANKAKLVQLARHLITHETIEGDELNKLFASEAPPLEMETEAAPATSD
jgi:cell division protease FtsH